MLVFVSGFQEQGFFVCFVCLFRAHTLTGGPGSPFSPGGPASSEKWVGSRSNVWKPSVAAGVTGISEVGLTSCTLVTFGSGFLEATVLDCFLWGG